jgi:hypothetical protein
MKFKKDSMEHKAKDNVKDSGLRRNCLIHQKHLGKIRLMGLRPAKL